MSRDLFTEWMSLRAGERGLHALELAERLQVSECELLASACGREGEVRPVRLAVTDWPAFISRLPALGRVKAVTRNPNAVIEVEGTYDQVKFFGTTGQSLSSLDLRIFAGRWRHGFAVTEETRRGTSHGLQFFDASGIAIHKLYLRPESDAAAYDALVAEHRAPDQSANQAVEPAEPPAVPRPDAEIDVEGFQSAWRALTDTHQFFGLLQRFGVERTQALRLAGPELAELLAPGALEGVLEQARATELPFMVFVGNPGIIQIHTGAVRRVAPMGPWVNVLDPEFNLHVRADRIEHTWLVRKPTADGVVTSVELYDARGQQIALLVGKRKPGLPEASPWRALAESLPRLDDSAPRRAHGAP